MNWKQWLQEYFYKGKTIGIYLLMLIFSISIIELAIYRVQLHSFIPLIIMSVFSYGLFTDLFAHLWYDNYDTGITYKEYLLKVFKGRTHDTYGLIVYIISAIYVFQYINHFWDILLIGMALIVLALIVKTKFYH